MSGRPEPTPFGNTGDIGKLCGLAKIKHQKIASKKKRPPPENHNQHNHHQHAKPDSAANDVAAVTKRI